MRANVRGTLNVVALGVPVVYYSTDYVFDGRKGALRGVGRAEPALRVRPNEAGGRARGARRLGRSLTVVVRGDRQLSADDARPRQAAREVSVVDDQRGSPTFVGHLAEATKAVLDLPYGTYHLAADGEATWAEFAEAIFDEAASSAGCAASRRPSSRWTPSALPFRPAQRAGHDASPRARPPRRTRAALGCGQRAVSGAWHRTWQ